MTATRRTFLAGVGSAAAAAATAAAAAPSATAAKAVKSAKVRNGARPNFHPTSLAPEFSVDASGALRINPDQQVSYTSCLGCTTQCGVRVRVDRKTGKVLRGSGWTATSN